MCKFIIITITTHHPPPTTLTLTIIYFLLDVINPWYSGGPSLTALLSLTTPSFAVGRVGLRHSAMQSMSITSVQVLLGCPQPWPPVGLTFCMAVPSESVGPEYLCQIFKLHPLQEIMWADLVLGGDTAHPVNRSSITALQAMQISWG